MLGTATAALFVASWLAQAEQAPPEPGSPAPTRPAAVETALSPPTSLAVHGRFAYRPGDSVGPAPAAGFSLGATFEHRYAMPLNGLGLGVGIDFFHDHFSRDGSFVDSTTPDLLTQTSFAALQTVSMELGRLRPWIAAGAGLTFAYFSGTGITPVGMPMPGVSASKIQPLVRGAVGLDITVAPQMAVVVRADLTHPLTRPTFGGFAYSPFGDLIDAGIGFLYRF